MKTSRIRTEHCEDALADGLVPRLIAAPRDRTYAASVSAPLRPLSPDTSLAAESVLIEHYRGLEVHERIAIAMDLTRMADEIALEGIRERHPDATEREQKLRLAALKYGRELVLKAFGWDPLVEGW